MRPPSSVGAVVAQRCRTERPERRPNAERQQLQRNGRRQLLYDLVGGDDDHEAVSGGCDDLLTGLRSAAALHQPTVRRHLIGAVDRQIEAIERVECLDGQAELTRLVLGLQRGRDAADVEPASRERRQEVSDRRPRAEPYRHPVPDELGRSLGREALFVVVAHRGTVGR